MSIPHYPPKCAGKVLHNVVVLRDNFIEEMGPKTLDECVMEEFSHSGLLYRADMEGFERNDTKATSQTISKERAFRASEITTQITSDETVPFHPDLKALWYPIQFNYKCTTKGYDGPVTDYMLRNQLDKVFFSRNSLFQKFLSIAASAFVRRLALFMEESVIEDHVQEPVEAQLKSKQAPKARPFLRCASAHLERVGNFVTPRPPPLSRFSGKHFEFFAVKALLNYFMNLDRFFRVAATLCKKQLVSFFPHVFSNTAFCPKQQHFTGFFTVETVSFDRFPLFCLTQ